jgi:hypothetical protein
MRPSTTATIDRSLPNTKARAVALVEKLGHLTGRPEERQAKIDAAIAEVAKEAATPAEHQAAEQKFNAAMRKILMDVSFLEKDFSWASFPNHGAHSDTAGCFRCHDGKHYNEQGEAIRLQCTLCHALPEVSKENGKSTVPSLVPEKAGEKQPESHQRPNFMHTHADDVNEDCEACHGTPLKRGKQGGAFCSNPACHGREWPNMTLDAEPKNAKTTMLPVSKPKGAEQGCMWRGLAQPAAPSDNRARGPGCCLWEALPRRGAGAAAPRGGGSGRLCHHRDLLEAPVAVVGGAGAF